MDEQRSATEAVVRRHLQAFLEQRGTAAIVDDYAESARFFTEAGIHHGKQQIAGFFTDFVDSLPAGAIERFTLRSMLVDEGVAYITWSVGEEIPLGTDTFVVADGKIVSQTFAMHVAAPQDEPGPGPVDALPATAAVGPEPGQPGR